MKNDRLNALTQAYVDGFARYGVPALVRNLSTSIEARWIGDRLLPVTINRSEPTDTYVCSLHTAYARYAREEIATLPTRAFDWPLTALTGGIGRALAAARIDDIVILNNWLLSTNLTGGLAIEDAGTLANTLAAEFPDSVLAIRSLNAWADADLLQSLVNARWQLLPSRQVWIADDLDQDWLGRRDTKRDMALAAATQLAREELVAVSDIDAARISKLYGMLYLVKYSRLNPDFTPAFVKLTHDIGMIRYVVLRDLAGTIQSVAGGFMLGGEVTTPIVGYDTGQPPEHGLYRLATLAIFETAHREHLRINLSSGAAAFKRNRGARPEIEYTAVYMRHLSRPRRVAIGLLRTLLARIGVPLMRRYQL